jgi:hypothetical protein
MTARHTLHRVTHHLTISNFAHASRYASRAVCNLKNPLCTASRKSMLQMQ